MKKIALLVSGLLALHTAQAQLGSVSLTGGSYSESFDGLAGGLPAGWHVFTAASASNLGYLRDTSVKLILTPGNSSTNGTKWTSTSGGFRNYASADNSATFTPYNTDTTGQLNATDRALGIRQVSKTNATFPASDSGASFSLKLANTAGLDGFSCTFKLQSLDSSSRRRTTWMVDYGFGDMPASFTPAAATGTLTTGAYTFSNNTVTVNFGSALDNQSGPVWIRIVTLAASDTLLADGSGPSPSGTTSNRPSTAIDDFSLSYSITGASCAAPTNLVAGNITTSGADLAWTAVSGASSYEYVLDQMSTDPAGAGTANAGTSYTASGLSASTMYYLHVRTDCGGANGFSAWSTVSFTTLADANGVTSVAANQMGLSVLGTPDGSSIQLAFSTKATGQVDIAITDLTGRVVFTQHVRSVAGTQRVSLIGMSLPAGMYIVRLASGKEQAAVKAVVR